MNPWGEEPLFRRAGGVSMGDSKGLKKSAPEVLLCDLDAFFASVEQRDRPEYRGKPVVVGGSLSGRGVVSTCSYEARKYGVHSAMPVERARKLCPEAIFLPGDMAKYRRVSRQVFAVYERFTPEIEIVSIDEAYLALPPGEGVAAATEIRRAVREELALSVTIGVSANKLLSKIASELAKPDRIGQLWPEQVERVLWPLSPALLPGLGPVSVEKLARVGIDTIGELAAAPLDLLQSYFGKIALTLQRSARGIDGRPLETVREAKSLSEEKTFSTDLADEEVIRAVLISQAESLGYRLRSGGLRARKVGIKVRYADFRTITREQTLPAPTDSDRELYEAAVGLFIEHKGRPPWRLIGLRASAFATGEQLSLFDLLPTDKKEKELQRTRDRLHERYGGAVVYRARRLLSPPSREDD